MLEWDGEKIQFEDKNGDIRTLTGDYARYHTGETVYVKEAWASKNIGGRVPLYKITYTDNTSKLATPAELNYPNCPKDGNHSLMFLPAAVARYFIEILEVRPERLQEITYSGARREGILSFNRDNPDPTNGGVGYNRGAPGLPMRYESTTAYMDLWDSINKKNLWSSNPYVWVYRFKLASKVTGQEGR